MLPERIRKHLVRTGADYRQRIHPRTETLAQAAQICGLSPGELIRAVTLRDDAGVVVAVIRHEDLLDFDALNRHLDRQLQPVPAEQLHAIFPDCDARCTPALCRPYEVMLVVESGIRELPRVHLEPGRHTLLLEFETAEYLRVAAPDAISSFAVTPDALDPKRIEKDLPRLSPARVRRTVEQEIHDLPPLPGTALRILELGRNPRAGAGELAAVIETDAALAARIMKYANSPLYGFPGRIRDLKGAIARVLGFDFVINLALGLAVGSTLKIPADGPLGLDAFWRHSLHCATLTERLSAALPGELRPPRGVAYLAGLLHNLGILLIGHAFPNEFFLLNRYLERNPEVPPASIEKRLLGVTHQEIGAWLLEAWSLPDELVVSARHHRDEDYWEKHAVCAQLVLLANRLLAAHGLGIERETRLPPSTLEMLELDPERAREITRQVLERHDNIEDLARRLVA